MIELSTDFSAKLQVSCAQGLHVESSFDMETSERIIRIWSRSKLSNEDAVAKIRTFAVDLQRALDDS